MHLFINSLAASAGGGLTYIRNVLPRLAARSDVKVTIALSSALREEFRSFEQCRLPGVARFSCSPFLVRAGGTAGADSGLRR